MSDVNKEVQKQEEILNKPLTMLQGPSGEMSSGRFVKVYSFIISLVMALGSEVISVIQLLSSKFSAGEFTAITLGLIGIFMGAATANEVTQKLTGK